MTIRSLFTTLVLLVMALGFDMPISAQDITLLPRETGSIRFFPTLGLTDVAPVGGLVQSGCLTHADDFREFRRGFMEFEIPAFPIPVLEARIVLTETRATSSGDMPPDLHELSSYPADLVVSVEDYDRPTTFIGSFETDFNEPTGTFSFDISNLLDRYQGQGIGFRVKLAMDPDGVCANQGSEFGALATLPPRIEVTLGGVRVPFDIKPQACPNKIPVGSQGMLAAAILGTDDFDVHSVDLTSLRLLGIAPLKIVFEDVAAPFQPSGPGVSDPLCTDEGPDGIQDLTLKFDAPQVMQAVQAMLGRPPEDQQTLFLSIRGMLIDGTPFRGDDEIIAVNKPAR
jgi:hypothetical protein